MAFLLPSISGIFNWVFVLIFSGYIGYDWYRAQNVAPTADNAIDCVCARYMDIVNLFIRLLRIFEKKQNACSSAIRFVLFRLFGILPSRDRVS